VELNVHAIDTASYQPRNLGPLIQAYQAKHVVPHIYMPNEGPGPQYSRDQINSTRDNDATVGGYVFPYRPTDSVDYYFHNTLDICASVGLALPVGWVDAEPSPFGPGPDERWMDAWVEKSLSVGMLPGLYCNRDWFVRHPEFQKYGAMGVVLWLANWDHVADVTVGWIPHGWTELAGKQWEVSPDTGLGEIDREVFREEYTVYESEDPEPEDPCADIRAELELKIEALAEAHAELDDMRDRMSQIRELAEGVPDLD
jgi:hypothetical protein